MLFGLATFLIKKCVLKKGVRDLEEADRVTLTVLGIKPR